MTRKRERVVAWVGVVVAVLSAIALSGAVLIQQYIDSHNTSQSQTLPSPTNSAQSCTDTATEQTLPVPDAYTVSGTVSSLQTTDLVVGTGVAAKSDDCVMVKYYGTLATNGKKFDENFTNTTGFAFTLGIGQVISGWDQGLIGMKEGGTRRLVIPSSLAYGSNPPAQIASIIPPNSALVFVVKLLRVQR